MIGMLVKSALHSGPEFFAPLPTLALQPTDRHPNPFSLHLHSNHRPKKAEKFDKSPQALDLAAFPPSVSYPGKFRQTSGKAVKQYGQGTDLPLPTAAKKKAAATNLSQQPEEGICISFSSNQESANPVFSMACGLFSKPAFASVFKAISARNHIVVNSNLDATIHEK